MAEGWFSCMRQGHGMGWKLGGALGVKLLSTLGRKRGDHGPELTGGKKSFFKRVGCFIAVGVSLMAGPALAAPASDAYAVLGDFLNGGAPAHAVAPAASASDAYAIVRSYAEQKGGDQPLVVAANEAKTEKTKTEKKIVKGGDAPATYVGSQACVQCHRNQFGNFAATLHGDIFLKKPRTLREKEGCEGCHGPASLHVKSKETDNGGPGDVIGFRKDSPRSIEERNAVCLSCHERGDRTYWKGSAHDNQGVACTNCHQIMEKVSVKYQLARSTEAETCFQCHKDRRAQFARQNHMPVGGIGSGPGSNATVMTCSSCHNPHGSATDKLLREASVNDTCYKCHADKRGPFLWEHEPVRDNCLNCHDPHGAVNDYMLKVQRPRLCQLCHMGPGHGNPGNPMTVQSVNRSCQNCHTKVHGSNSPAGMLFQR